MVPTPCKVPQTGLFAPPPDVTGQGVVPPVAGIVKMSPPFSNTIELPSGDQWGFADFLPFTGNVDPGTTKIETSPADLRLVGACRPN